MAKEFELNLQGDSIEELIKGEIPVEQFLEDTFENKDNSKVITERLASYYYDDGGSPEVRELEIVNATFKSDSLMGSFRCDFRVYYFFGCSDIKNDKKENITWQFKLDTTTSSIAFIGEEPWTRDAE